MHCGIPTVKLALSLAEEEGSLKPHINRRP
jgi:hypothetical protein